jgi:hypothetical protein
VKAVVPITRNLQLLQSIFDLPPSPLRKVNLRVQRKLVYDLTAMDVKSMSFRMKRIEASALER